MERTSTSAATPAERRAAGATVEDAGSERRWNRAARALVVVVLGLLLVGAWRVGPTYDEHYYIASGRAYLDEPFFGLNREHPPLLKYMAGLPLLLLGADPVPGWRDELSYPASFFYGRYAADVDRNLFAARVPFCLLAAAAVWIVFRVGRSMFGARAGFVGAAFLGLNPNWLAHGRLAALDAGIATFVFIALVAFVRALEVPTARRTLAAAVAFGVANLAKFTGLLLGPAFVALAAVVAWRERSARPVLVLARVLLAGFTVFAAGYAFEVRAINAAWGEPGYPSVVNRADPDQGDLAAALDRGFGDGPRPAGADILRHEVRHSRTPTASVARLVQGLAEARSAELARAVVDAFGALEGSPGPGRRDAVAALLDARPEDIGDELYFRRLEQLAERRIAREGDAATRRAEWVAWFDSARHEDWNERIFTQRWIDRALAAVFGSATPIPLISAIKGVDYQFEHGARGHSTYFRGKTLVAGRDFTEGNPHPEYYAVVMAVKNPLAAIAAVSFGFVLAFTAPRRFGGLRLVAYAGFPLACFAMFSIGNALMGVRYVLPLFPFLALFAARLAAGAPRIALGLLGVAVLESIWIHPHELMYYNALAGGPERGPAITVVSDDWGQGARAVGRFYARHREEIERAGGLWYNPYLSADPRALGLGDVRTPDPRRPVQGIVAVDAVSWWRDRSYLRWLERYEPFAHLDRCVLLFDTRGPAPGGDPGWR